MNTDAPTRALSDALDLYGVFAEIPAFRHLSPPEDRPGECAPSYGIAENEQFVKCESGHLEESYLSSKTQDAPDDYLEIINKTKEEVQ